MDFEWLDRTPMRKNGSKLRAQVASKKGPHKRPDALSDAAVAKIVAETYARRPGGW